MHIILFQNLLSAPSMQILCSEDAPLQFPQICISEQRAIKKQKKKNKKNANFGCSE